MAKAPREQRIREDLAQLALDYALIGDAEARLQVLEDKGKRAIEQKLPLISGLRRVYDYASDRPTWRTPRSGSNNTRQEGQATG